MTSLTRSPKASQRGDSGYAVLEAAIVLPVAFLLLMVVAQGALVWHARSAAETAAQEGLRTAQAYGATAAQGQSDTVTYLRQVAPHLISDPAVTVTRTDQGATVQVHGRVVTLLPFASLTVTEIASGPTETYAVAQ